MKAPRDAAFVLLQDGIVHLAARLVPTIHRVEWRQEWIAELWHVRRSCACFEPQSWDAQRQTTLFCLGAIPDALCVRGQQTQTSSPPVRVDGSAAHCLLALCVVMAVCLILAQLLPGVQAEKDAARFQIAPSVLVVADTSAIGERPSIPHNLFRNWKATRQRYFQDLAFYRISHETASLGSTQLGWRVAHSTFNLFSLLGLHLKNTVETSDQVGGLTPVILSYRVWMRDFAGDRQIAGDIIHVGLRTARIAGVAPDGGWRMPGEPDVWMLEPDSQIASDERPGSKGYLIAQLSRLGEAEMLGNGISIAAQDLQHDDIDLYGAPLAVEVVGASNIYTFALFLALLALPAVTSVSLGETCTSSRLSRRQGFYRFMFMVAKFLLIAAIALYGSLDCAYWYTSTYSSSAESIQLLSGFLICLFGFRWAIADQRRRCPVCLRRVTHPASVGLASRTFLGWNGTEMMCMGGHTLLHVPSLPTSWFSGDRWLFLDSSWEFLFADPYPL